MACSFALVGMARVSTYRSDQTLIIAWKWMGLKGGYTEDQVAHPERGYLVVSYPVASQIWLVGGKDLFPATIARIAIQHCVDVRANFQRRNTIVRQANRRCRRVAPKLLNDTYA